MKKLLLPLFLFAGLALQAQGITFMITQNNSSTISGQPVWVTSYDINNQIYMNYKAYTNSNGVVYDSLPVGYAYKFSTYDCSGNYFEKTGTVVAVTGVAQADTMDISCGISSSQDCAALFHVLGSSGGLTLNLQDSTNMITVPGSNDFLEFDFGDGHRDTIYQAGGSVNHTFSQPGSYQVCLSANRYDNANNITVCSDTYCRDFTVGMPPNACGNLYIYDTVVIQQLNTIYFQVSSSDPILAGSSSTYHYEFGDGTTTAGGAQVTHTYPSSGSYNFSVTRIRYNSFGDSICAETSTKTVNVANGSISANFGTWGQNGNVTIVDSSYYALPVGAIPRFIIDFGDGSTDTTYDPNHATWHTYQNPGSYNICYTVELVDSLNLSVLGSDTRCKNFNVNYNCSLGVTDSADGNNVGFFNIWASSGGPVTRIVTIDFGDGTSLSNPPINSYFTHTYPSAGTYNYSVDIKVVHSNGDTVCTDSYQGSIVVGASSLYCDARFAHYVNPSGIAQFSNQSQAQNLPPNAWVEYLWVFGDGDSSNVNSPAHQYQPGTYSVCLYQQVIDSATQQVICSSDTCKTIQVGTTPTVWCSAGFQKSVNGSTVSFINTSTYGNTSSPGDTAFYVWYFGDGDTSVAIDPVHTYSQPGTYMVELYQYVYSMGSLSCSRDTAGSVTISTPAPVNCQADFTASVDSIDPSFVHFTNLGSTSGVPASAKVEYTWNYGNGAWGTNPFRQYAVAGTYNVCLIVEVIDTATQSILCMDSICKAVTVSGPSYCEASYIVDTANSYFGNVYIWNTSDPALSDPGYTNHYTWDFGDGDTANQPFPVHTYANPGMYTVCVTINSMDANQNVCTDTYCDTLGVDSLGNLIYKGSNTGFTLNVLNPETIGLEEENPFSAVEMYPNPARNQVTLDFGGYEGNVDWKVTDLKGALVKEGSASDKSIFNIKVEDLKNGIYILTLINEEFPVAHHKLVIDR